jgi:hypothetical protein
MKSWDYSNATKTKVAIKENNEIIQEHSNVRKI